MTSSVVRPRWTSTLSIHHLVEQRRDQREQLDEERDDEDFQQQLAVLDHAGMNR